MTYEITSIKTLFGWEAYSEAIIGETAEGTRVLKLTTSKTGTGIDSSATVFIRSNKDGYYTETTVIFGDFYKRGIAPTPCNRVTEKAVLQAHKYAISKMDELIQEAKIFYANQVQ